MANMKEVLYTQRARSVLSILDSASLQGHGDLAEALAELDRKIHEPETNVAEVARDICSVPHMFEVVMSGKSFLSSSTSTKRVHHVGH